jgi:hypothetical protein
LAPRRSLILPFYLTRSAQVQVEAEGLAHLDRGANAAPELFLDDEYLGPLLAEHHGAWRSPRQVKLAGGSHQLLVRNAQVEDAEDFELKRIFVYAGGPDSEPVKTGAPKASPLPTAAPAPQENPLAADACGRPRRDWPQAKKGGVMLSVLSGRTIGTGTLVHLAQGETWACAIKVSAPYSKPLPLMAGFSKGEGVQGRWILSLDPDPPKRVEPKGYKPSRWERFQARLCQGQLSLRFGQAPPLKLPWPQDALDLEIAAQSVEVALKPTP